MLSLKKPFLVWKNKRKTVTVEELCTIWLEEKRRTIKLSTYVKYSNLIKMHILPQLGSRYVNALKREDIEQYTNFLLTEGRVDGKGGLSGKTARDILNLLHNILSYAVAAEFAETVPPFDGMLWPAHRRKPEIMDRTECQRLEIYLRQKGDPVSCGILLSLYTGMRLGEICALRWKNIDLERRVLLVDATMQRLQNPESRGPKTSVLRMSPKSACAVRMIPLPEHLVTLLEPLYPVSSDAYFLTGSSERCMEPRLLEYRFKQTIQSCALKNIHFHTLRHTFATRCVEVGFDTKSLSEILGHANVRTTMTLYVHPTMEHKRKNMNMVYF